MPGGRLDAKFSFLLIASSLLPAFIVTQIEQKLRSLRRRAHQSGGGALLRCQAERYTACA